MTPDSLPSSGPGHPATAPQSDGLFVDAEIRVNDGLVPVQLSVARGELVAVAGSIGSGKSTVLKLIAGLVPPASGVVQFSGIEWSRATPPDERRVSLMPQDFRSALDPALTVMDIITEYCTRDEAKTLLLSLTLGDHVVNRASSTLSNGEAQRSALAVCLAKRPNVLLLDEPFSALDPLTNDSVHAWLDGWLAQTGIPTLIVSGDPEDQHHFADRVFNLDEAHTIV